jgi:hypothetical protein
MKPKSSQITTQFKDSSFCVWGDYTSSLKDFTRQNLNVDLWGFKVYDVCTNWTFKIEAILKVQGFMKICIMDFLNGVYRFWNLVLELVNHNGVQNSWFLCCNHNGACCFGPTRGVFASPNSQFEIWIHVSLNVATCRFVSMTILNPWVLRFSMFFFLVLASYNLRSCDHCCACKLWSCLWWFFVFLLVFYFYYYGITCLAFELPM